MTDEQLEAIARTWSEISPIATVEIKWPARIQTGSYAADIQAVISEALRLRAALKHARWFVAAENVGPAGADMALQETASALDHAIAGGWPGKALGAKPK